MPTFIDENPGVRDFTENLAGVTLDWQPTQLEVIESFLRLDNTLFSSVEGAFDTFAADPYYDPFQDIEGFEQYASEFTFSRSQLETAQIKSRIAQRQRDHLIIQQASTLQNLAAAALGGTLDPVNIFFAALTPGLSNLNALNKPWNDMFPIRVPTAKTGVKLGAGAALTSEAILQAQQSDRPLAASAANILAAGGFGGVAMIPVIMKHKKLLTRQMFDDLAGRFNEEMKSGLGKVATGVRGTRSHHDPAFGGFGATESASRNSAFGYNPQRAGSNMSASLGAERRRGLHGAGERSPEPLRGTPGGPGTIADAKGIDAPLSVLAPIIQVLRSSIGKSASVIEDLAEFGGFHTKNFAEEAHATKTPVETLVKRHSYALASFLTAISTEYSVYRGRVTGTAPKGVVDSLIQSGKDFFDKQGARSIEERGFMLPNEFNSSVTSSLRNPDLDVVPEVRKLSQRLRKKLDTDASLAVQHGLLQAEDLIQNWVPRIWNPVLVRQGMTDLVDIIHNDQVSRLGAAAKSKGEIRGQLEMVIHSADAMENVDLESLKTSPKSIFKERTIDVDDKLIVDYLENDIDIIMRTYNRQFAVDIELTKKFGDVGMTKQLDEIKFQAFQMMEGKSINAKQKIADQLASDLRNIEAMRDILRGNYGLPKDPYSFGSTAARLITDFAHMTMLGGVVVSSLPDMGRIIMANGIENAFPMLKLMVSDLKTWKVAANEAKLAGTALDMVLQSRAMALINHGELPQRFTRAEAITGRMTNAFFIANLLSPWNSFLKQAAGVTVGHRIIKHSRKFVKGTASKNDIARLRAAGIDDEMTRRIAAQAEAFGERVQDVWIPNTEKWQDIGALDAFRNSMVRDVDSTIVTPGIGDQPLFAHAGLGAFSKETQDKFPAVFLHPSWGKLITMYKSFVFASATRVLLPGMQIRDASTLHGALMMTYVGALVVSLKDKMNGRPGTDSVHGFILDGIDQSGMGTWFVTLNNMIESITNNEVGVRPLLGTAPPWSTTLTWKAGSVLGPAASIAGRTLGIGADVLLGDMDYQTALNVWRSVPYNNLFWLKMGNATQMGDWMDQLSDEGGGLLSLGNRSRF